MIQARKELLEHQSLEESYLITGGGELASLVCPQVPHSDYLEAQGISFSCPRPGSVGCSRSTMCTTSSSRSETPPLSSNASLSTPSNRRTHARGPGGQGYHCCLLDVHRSTSSAYETIQEEGVGSSDSGEIAETEISAAVYNSRATPSLLLVIRLMAGTPSWMINVVLLPWGYMML